MKIVTLNIWGGKISKELYNFFEVNKDVDVFLLQEVFHEATEVTVWDNDEQGEVFSEIADLLKEHTGYFAPSVLNEWGLAMFIKNSITVEETGDIFVHKNGRSLVGRDPSTGGRNIQYAQLLHKGDVLTMINFHGLWNGNGKTDTEDRLNQSQRIVDFIKHISHDVVLAGDFNLRPDTESLQLVEKDLGLRNLISDFGITSTRTSYYTKSERFADYVFVSPSIKVRNFEVMKEEVSDHSPLLLEI